MYSHHTSKLYCASYTHVQVGFVEEILEEEGVTQETIGYLSSAIVSEAVSEGQTQYAVQHMHETVQWFRATKNDTFTYLEQEDCTVS